MSHYLHVSVGDYQLLVRTNSILALADGDSQYGAGNDKRLSWQNRSLPMSTRFDQFFDSSAERKTAIVFGQDIEDENAFALLVDEVIGSRDIAGRSLDPVPPFNEEFARLFDGAYLDPDQSDGICLLRLRDPMAALAPEKENAA